jgi:drug/metabolite transporter (DMT)-like permease
MTSSWMIVAAAMFAAMGAFVKLGAQEFGTAELAFYRSVITLAAAVGLVAWHRGSVFSPFLKTHLLRSFLGMLTLVTYFYALSQIPLATAMTLAQTSPLMLAVLTVTFMGERFSGWLLFAIVLGFAGVGLLLQPTFEAGKAQAAFLGLWSALFASLAYLNVRTLGRAGEPAWRIVFWFSFVCTVFTAGWQLTTSTFHAVHMDNVWILVGIGVTGTLGQLMMTRAYHVGNTIVVSALSYSTLIFAAIAGLVLFNDAIPPLGWVGMGIIIVSGLIAVRVEKKEIIEEAGFEG